MSEWRYFLFPMMVKIVNKMKRPKYSSNVNVMVWYIYTTGDTTLLPIYAMRNMKCGNPKTKRKKSEKKSEKRK